MKTLTIDRLRYLLSYDELTGVFLWVHPTGPRHKMSVGDVAGCLDKRGYRLIRIDGVLHRAHILAWFYVRGVWPAHVIDHKHGVSNGNGIANLRDVPQSINTQNARGPRSNNSCGVLGASYNKRDGNYSSKIKVDGRSSHLGYYATAEEAGAVYLKAKRAIHVGCTI